MKIKSSIMLLITILLLTTFSNGWASGPPQVVSSIPANGHLTADPWTKCIDITFSEPMNEAHMIRVSDTFLEDDDYRFSSWSLDGKTFHYCRASKNSPLPVGRYWIKLNPAGYSSKFKAAATQIALPETYISFTVTANGSNGTVPQVISSIPANGAANVNPMTSYLLEVTFSEIMDTSHWLISRNGVWSTEMTAEWNASVVSWSLDGRTFRLKRNTSTPLPAGTYGFILSRDHDPDYFFMSVAGIHLAETTIKFTVSSNPTDSKHTYYIPYFNTGNGSWTGVGISNNSGQNTASVSIMLFNADGSTLSQEPPLAIVANGQYSGVLAENNTATGWVKISSQEELSGLCFMGSTMMADIPFVSELSENLMIPHVAQDDDWDTSVMICNPNDTQTTLKLTYFSKKGQSLVYTPPQPLVAHGSASYNLADIFASHLPLKGGKLKLSVVQGGGIAAFALYKDTKKGRSHYAGISAIPVSSTDTPHHPF